MVYAPDASLVADVVSLVSWLIASIFAPGTAPPLESNTWPEIVERNSCAVNAVQKITKRETTKNSLARKIKIPLFAIGFRKISTHL